jgi:hypothetical protein
MIGNDDSKKTHISVNAAKAALEARPSVATTRLGPASDSPEMPMGMSEGRILDGSQTREPELKCRDLDLTAPVRRITPILKKEKRQRIHD